jgi:hypothetical protein
MKPREVMRDDLMSWLQLDCVSAFPFTYNPDHRQIATGTPLEDN